VVAEADLVGHDSYTASGIYLFFWYVGAIEVFYNPEVYRKRSQFSLKTALPPDDPVLRAFAIYRFCSYEPDTYTLGVLSDPRFQSVPY
jgi:hypothetical protein